MSATKTPDIGEAVRSWYDAVWEPWKKLLSPDAPCGCEQQGDCGCDPCSCCVPESDVLVQARPGERRVVPMTLRNPGRRPLELSVDIGPFLPCGPDTGVRVQASVRPRPELTLAPCEEVTFALVLEVSGPAQHVAVPVEGTKRKAPPREGTEKDRHDHDACATLVADVRLGGCGSRPVRVAVTVLPLACSPYDVHCSCGCC